MRLHIKALLFTFVIAFQNTYSEVLDKCLILMENGKVIAQEGKCDKRHTPCTTFEIPLAIIGLDVTSKLQDTSDTKTPLFHKIFWNCFKDHTKHFRNNTNFRKELNTCKCLYTSEIFANTLGYDNILKYVNIFNYGNKNIQGLKDYNHHFYHSWMSSSLSISNLEQAKFLEKLANNQLYNNTKVQSQVMKAMYKEVLRSGWKLYCTSAACFPVDKNSQQILDRRVGWFVGFLKKNGRTISFAVSLVDTDLEGIEAAFKAKQALLNATVKYLK